MIKLPNLVNSINSVYTFTILNKDYRIKIHYNPFNKSYILSIEDFIYGLNITTNEPLLPPYLLPFNIIYDGQSYFYTL